MATLKVYGVPQSQPVRSVLWALAIHGVPHELVKAAPGRKTGGGTKSPEFLAKFPSGTVPAIDDGGFLLTECNAILRYLAAKHAWTEYYPKDVERRARVDFFLSWHHRNSRELTIALFAPAARPDLNLKVNDKVAPKVLGKLEQFLAASSGPFLTGGKPTLADIVVYGDIGQCQDKYCALCDFGPFPRVRQWLAAVEAVPHHGRVQHEPLSQLGAFFRRAKAKM